jgi:hypothetical protein
VDWSSKQLQEVTLTDSSRNDGDPRRSERLFEKSVQ